MMQLQDIAEIVYDYALKQAYAPITPSKRKPTPDEFLQDPAFRQRLRVGLAQGVANVLAAYDERVLSAHLVAEMGIPHEEAEVCTLPDATVWLLVLVSARSAALDALGAALDQALAREVRKLPAPLLNQQGPLLNPTFITENDVAHRKGLAVLFSPAFDPPLTIWKRDGSEAC